MNTLRLSCFSLALLGAGSAASSAAFAADSVTLYGVIDTSIQYVNHANSQGEHRWGMADSNLSGSRWGVKGAEDLGGGLKAIFQLENGFNPNSGGFHQGGRMFGRQAFVGLSGDQWGTVTLGRQYDPLVDMIQPLTADNDFSSMFSTPGDVDNNDNSSRTNNAIKYVSPVFSGFQFEGLYALGGVAGQTGSGQTWSGAATYSIGQFSAAAGYFYAANAASSVKRTGWSSTSDGTFDGNFDPNTPLNNGYVTAKSIGIASVAVQYVMGPVKMNLRYSNAQYRPDAQSAFGSTERYNVGGAYVGYQATPALLLGLGYIYTKADGNTSATYHQVSAGADYSLSKRTDVYLMGTWQHASGTQGNGKGGTAPAEASIGSYGYSSNNTVQAIATVGIRHKF
ncbi:porin [Paraburkholderia sp. Ac-20340]|uniref:porin n=1 Tax=Paraburkholderia sp. Ac-20340 TaxID=2703888 RepID=UPI00198148A4|nr:porin [Paraburkholderia sp. Ac-20340]MBN3852179.1 porin [Paraburkholderia sp. Ac-20340]